MPPYVSLLLHCALNPALPFFGGFINFLLPFSFLLSSHAPHELTLLHLKENWFLFWSLCETLSQQHSEEFPLPPELDGANSLSWGHFSLHFICLPFSLPPPLLPLLSSEHTEIEQAWLMQHLSPPNVSFAQPFYAWLLFGKLLFMHLPTLYLNDHISRSIKQFDFLHLMSRISKKKTQELD